MTVTLPAVLTVIQAVLTLSVSASLAYFAYQQWKTARSKVRLDLYNRRFEVYSAAWDYHVILSFWQGPNQGAAADHVKQRAAAERFFKAKAEARFLFAEGSNVSKVLEELAKEASGVRGYVEYSRLSDPPEERLRLLNEHDDRVLATIPALMKQLQRNMGPYLNFHRVD